MIGETISLTTLFIFYKNLVYKNIKASNGPKIKNILRTYEGFKSLKKILLRVTFKEHKHNTKILVQLR